MMPKPDHPPASPALTAWGLALRQRRRDRGLTLAQLALRANLAKSYLSMVENGQVDHPPSDEALTRLEAALRLTPGELRESAAWHRAEEPVRREAIRRVIESARHRADGTRDLDALFTSGELARRVASSLRVAPIHAPLGGLPLINLVPAGTPSDFTDLDYPARVADRYLPRPPGVDDPDAFAATILGDSMTPELQPGDVVVFAPNADTPDGCVCFVRLDATHEVTIKRIRLHTDDAGVQQITLIPTNPAHPPRTLPRDAIAGLYRAVWKMQKL